MYLTYLQLFYFLIIKESSSIAYILKLFLKAPCNTDCKLLKTVIYYIILLYFDQINTALLSIRDFFKTVCMYVCVCARVNYIFI